MRAVETTPATSLGAGEELSLAQHAQWETERATLIRGDTSKLGRMIGLCGSQRAVLDRDSVSNDSGRELWLDRDQGLLGIDCQHQVLAAAYSIG